MGNIFASIRRMFEKDPVTMAFVILVIILVLLAVWLYRHRTKDSRDPDILDHDGYYRIALSPAGYTITSDRNLFRTITTFYYLRKDPFSIEVSLDEVEAKDGKKYRALAVAQVVLPEDRVDYVCRRYFNGQKKQVSTADTINAIINKNNYQKSTAADIFSSQPLNRKSDPDEMLRMMISGSGASTASDTGKRNRERTNCDADIDSDLIIAFSSSLKKLIAEHGGTISKEELKKKFHAVAMMEAMATGHAVTEIPVFNIIENNE